MSRELSEEPRMVPIVIGRFYPSDISDGTLQDAVNFLMGQVAIFGPDATVGYQEVDYTDGVYDFTIHGTRPETPKEIAQRIDREQRRLAYQAEKDRAEYERLRKLFGG